MLSKTLENLYIEVESLLAPNKLYVLQYDRMPDKILELSGRAYCKPLVNGDYEIGLLKNEPQLECVLSHELFHVFLDINDFPNVYSSNRSIGEFSLEIGHLLNQAVLHKIIVKKQLGRGLKMEKKQKNRLEGVVDKLSIGTSLNDKDLMRHTVILTSLMIEAGDYLQEHESELASKRPFLYAQARRIYDEINKSQYDTPFETRKVLVKLFNTLDHMMNSDEPIELSKNVLVFYIFSRRQLSLKVTQVFTLSLNYTNNLLSLFSKSDGQLSLFFEDKTRLQMEEIASMTIEGLFELEKLKLITHD